MDNNLFLAYLFISSLIFMVEYASSTSSTSCSQTPYPKICSHFINTNLLSSLDPNQQRYAFRDLALKATLNQALKAHDELVISNSNALLNLDRPKLAWKDCLELYEDTIDKLNRSVSSTDALDVNTWLSASIANQQTCQNGFIDLNIPDSHVQAFPNFVTLASNLDKLLSNSLAIEKGAKQDRWERILVSQSDDDDKFPDWISFSDRKLLQSGPKADIVVAQDGSGNFKTISEALGSMPSETSGRLVVHVKAGVYRENIEIKKTMKNIMFVGDGIDATIVTGSRNNNDGSTTFRSATFGVSGDGFIARDMTFENTAGPAKHQAVAFRSGADHSVMYRCSFKGYQDTLYVYSQRQFYRDCDIHGTVDIVFGDAMTVLQNCNIYVRKPLSYQKNTVTAQGRNDPNENTGIIIHNSRITAAQDLKAVQGSFKTFLGRPWMQYSRTVVMKSNIDGLVDGAGWYPWSGNFALSTLYYGEYMNVGAGAATGGRVKWPGYHVITSAAEAGKFTVGNALAGQSWIPATGVPFVAGL